MKCEEARELLSEYMDGELDAAQRAEVDRHVQGCKACTQELTSLRATVSLVASLGRVEAPEGLAGSVSDALSHRAKGKIIWPSARLVGSLLAAAAVLFVVSVTFLLTTQKSPEVTAPLTEAPARPPAIRGAQGLGRAASEAEREESAAVEKPSLPPPPAEVATKAEAPRAPEPASATPTAPLKKASPTPSFAAANAPHSAGMPRNAPAEKGVAVGKEAYEPAAPKALNLEERKAHAEPAPTTVGTAIAKNEEVAGEKMAEVAEQPQVPMKAKARAVQDSLRLREQMEPADEKKQDVAKTPSTEAKPAPAPAAKADAPALAFGRDKSGVRSSKTDDLRADRDQRQAEGRRILIRSRNPQADMDRVRSLLKKYVAATAAQTEINADAEAQKDIGRHFLTARIPADQLAIFLGDLNRLGLPVAPPAYEQRQAAAGGASQPQVQQQAMPTIVELTILFEKAE